MRHLIYTFFYITTFTLGVSAQPTSEYDPSVLEHQTQEITDSVLSLIDSSQIYVTDKEIQECKYILYWNKNKSKVPDKDFINLANHYSPVIRYNSYKHMLNLAPSKVEFINYHLEDLEFIQHITYLSQQNEQTWRLVDNKWIKAGPGFMPLIQAVIKTVDLTKEELDTISRAIVQKDLKSDEMTEFALSLLSLSENNYPIIKSLALQGNMTATLKLAEYQEEENQDFLLNRLDSLFENKRDRTGVFLEINKRFIEHSVKYDYPKGSIDLFLMFYEKLKANKITRNRQFTYLYQNYAVNGTPIKKKLLTRLLSEASSKNDEKRNEIFNQIKDLIADIPESEMIDFRIEFWGKGGWINCSSIRYIKGHDPSVAYRIAKTELDKLENDKFRQKNCFRKLVSIISKNGSSPEKYINWALQSRQRDLPYTAVSLARKYKFSSSKAFIFRLMDSDNNPWQYKMIIDALIEFEFSESEKDQIGRWIKLYKGKEHFNESLYPLEEILDKIGKE